MNFFLKTRGKRRLISKSPFENSQSTSFFEKKEAKKLPLPVGCGTGGAKSHRDEKFFASFFQKRSPYLRFQTASKELANLTVETRYGRAEVPGVERRYKGDDAPRTGTA